MRRAAVAVQLTVAKSAKMRQADGALLPAPPPRVDLAHYVCRGRNLVV